MAPAIGVEREGTGGLPDIFIRREYMGKPIEAKLEPYLVNKGGFTLVFWEYGQAEPFMGGYEPDDNKLYRSLFRIDSQTTSSPYITAVYITPDDTTSRGLKMAWSNTRAERWGLKLTGVGESSVRVMDLTELEAMNEVARKGFVGTPYTLSEGPDGGIAIKEIPIGGEVIVEGTSLAVLPVLVKNGWSGGVLIASLDLVTSRAWVSGKPLSEYLSGEAPIKS